MSRLGEKICTWCGPVGFAAFGIGVFPLAHFLPPLPPSAGAGEIAAIALTSAAPDTKPRHLPGEEGVWVFICGDMVVFAMFFVTFAIYRAESPAVFAAGHRSLSQALGLANTLVLLTSSWFVAVAVKLARGGKKAAAIPLLLAAIACGLVFGAIKAIEYSAKFAAGHTVMSDDFYMFYFMFTGIHMVHVVIGMIVLSIMIHVARRPATAAGDIALIEGGGVFWHLVDLLWIVLFCLFYVLR